MIATYLRNATSHNCSHISVVIFMSHNCALHLKNPTFLIIAATCSKIGTLFLKIVFYILQLLLYHNYNFISHNCYFIYHDWDIISQNYINCSCDHAV